LSPTQITFLKQTNNYFNNMSTITVAKALEKVNISTTLVKYIRENRDKWTTFGKKNSHLLRAQLFRMFESFSMQPEEIFMIFFFFSVIKNRNRVLSALDNMEQSDKGKSWYKKVHDFVEKKLVQYVSEEKGGKFAAVHLPTTMPGLDILCTVLTMTQSDEDYEELVGKQTFAQLNLSEELQDKNKGKQIDFWNKTVNGSRNPDSKAYKSGFVEDFYKNSAGDKYNLIMVDGKEVEPNDINIGYTEDEIKKWIEKVLNHAKVKNT